MPELMYAIFISPVKRPEPEFAYEENFHRYEFHPSLFEGFGMPG